jgi:two-component system, chemotaxis family, sensor kinase Cph1
VVNRPDIRPEVAVKTDLLVCDAEPIHIPGAIQRFGMLVAMDASGRICRVSANLSEFLPVSPDQVLGQPIESVLGATVTGLCRTYLSALEHPEDRETPIMFDADLPGGAGPYTLTLTRSPSGLIIQCEPNPQEPDPYIHALRWVAESCERLRLTHSSLALLETAAQIIAERGHWHRTMVYRFDSEMNGDIIAEVVHGVEPRWLDHHFPHSDIPAQARSLYLRNRIRMITDIDYTPSPLLGLNDEVLDLLDLSDIMLRSVSPMHVEYLQNMGVRATLTMSLVVEGRLWGMIVCHHQEPRYAPWPLRLFCDLIAQFVSLQLQHLLAEEQRLDLDRLEQHVDRLMDDMRLTDSISEAVIQCGQLLESWQADAFQLVLHGERTVLGRPLPESILKSIEMALRHENCGRTCAIERIAPLLSSNCPDPEWVAGALYLPLTNNRDDHLLWLRREQIQQVKWGHQPDKDPLPTTGDKPVRLSTRGSFETWIEEVRGRCLSWTSAQTQAAHYLAQVIRNQLATELKLSREREELTRRMAHYDPLTGLPNRILLMQRLQGAIARAQHHQGAFAVCFIDLNTFKPINDQFGHAEGDEALKAVAGRLSTLLRDGDSLARIGGDEFVALIEDIGHEGADRIHIIASEVAQSLIASLDEPVTVGSHRHGLGASIGIACYPELADTPTALLRAADLAMYAAKKGGSNPSFAAPPDLEAISEASSQTDDADF